ncbi:unnamed protein product [Ectocarpus sp. 12 AP-2014]
MLIARCCPIMRVLHLKGGQLGYGGHVVNVAQDISTLAAALPRLAADVPITIIRREGQEPGQHKDLHVRRARVQRALLWLIANNPYYRDIVLDGTALSQLPVDGQLRGLRTTVSGGDSERDLGPRGEGEGKEDGDTPEDTESFMAPAGKNMLEDRAIEAALRRQVRESGADVPVNAWPGMEATALNEFKTTGLASMAFPALFPWGKGDPTDPARSRSVKPTDGMRRLLKYFRDGRYRFASHSRFPHWCQNMLERHRMLSQAQVYLKQNPGDAAMTMEHMRILFRSGSPLAQQLTQRMCRYGANITGSRPYWYAKQQELKAIFATRGCATLFFTLSAADTHWDGLFDLMPPGYQDSPAGKRRALIENPHIADTYFGNRADALTSAFFGGVLQAQSLWYRLEYQGRGSTHAHGCAWLQDDPGIVDLVCKAYEGRKAAERLEAAEGLAAGQGGIGDEEERQALERAVADGKTADSKVCRYADWLISTVNTRSPEERAAYTGGVPDPHPCSVNSFKHGPVSDEATGRADIDGLINCCQRHVCRPEGYCRRAGRQGCRFGFPHECQPETSLQFEEMDNGSVRATIKTKRNDGNLNSYCRLALSHWRANIDFQLILDWDQAVRYMVKYVSKGEMRSPAAADVFARVISRADDDADEAQTVLRSVFLKCTGERDISAQETARLLLGNKLYSFSFSFVRLVVDPSTSTRQVNLDGAAGEGALKKSMRNLYAGRRSVIDKYPSIMGVSFFQFHRCTLGTGGGGHRETWRGQRRRHQATCPAVLSGEPAAP